MIRLLLLIILILASMWVGYAIHACIEQDQPTLGPISDPMSTDEALEFLEYCIYNHNYYADHPELCNATSGNVSFNQEILANYRGVMSLLKEVERRAK